MRAGSSESAGPFAVSVNSDSNEITDPLCTDLLIGMDQKTVMLVNDALSKRGVLLLKPSQRVCTVAIPSNTFLMHAGSLESATFFAVSVKGGSFEVTTCTSCTDFSLDVRVFVHCVNTQEESAEWSFDAKVVIISAGWASVAAADHLHKAGVSFVVFEAKNIISTHERFLVDRSVQLGGLPPNSRSAHVCVRSTTGIIISSYGADGSLTLYLGGEQPASALQANWLLTPTNEKGVDTDSKIVLVFRVSYCMSHFSLARAWLFSLKAEFTCAILLKASYPPTCAGLG